MKATQHKAGFNKLKATYVLLGVAVMLALGSYGWHLYALYQAWQRDTPQPQVERLVCDLRRFHTETKQFPASFLEINQRLWHTQPAPDYGTDGKQARVKNYLYRDTRVESQQCVLWALPVGSQRQIGETFFVVITPGRMRVWQGNSFTDEIIAGLSAVPTPQTLAKLQMRELPARSVGSP